MTYMQFLISSPLVREIKINCFTNMSEMKHAAWNSITVSLAISQKIKFPKKLLILKNIYSHNTQKKYGQKHENKFSQMEKDDRLLSSNGNKIEHYLCYNRRNVK